jgi:hypothetical protein
MKKWVQIIEGVRIDGRHVGPETPPFEVDEKFAAYLVASSKGRIVGPPLAGDGTEGETTVPNPAPAGDGIEENAGANLDPADLRNPDSTDADSPLVGDDPDEDVDAIVPLDPPHGVSGRKSGGKDKK